MPHGKKILTTTNPPPSETTSPNPLDLLSTLKHYVEATLLLEHQNHTQPAQTLLQQSIQHLSMLLWKLCHPEEEAKPANLNACIKHPSFPDALRPAIPKLEQLSQALESTDINNIHYKHLESAFLQIQRYVQSQNQTPLRHKLSFPKLQNFSKGWSLLLLSLIAWYGIYLWMAPQGTHYSTGKLYWRTPTDKQFIEAHSQTFSNTIDQNFHEYQIHLSPKQHINQLRLDPDALQLDYAIIDYIQLKYKHKTMKVLSFKGGMAYKWRGNMKFEKALLLSPKDLNSLQKHINPVRVEALRDIQDRVFFDSMEFVQTLHALNLSLKPEELKHIITQAQHFHLKPSQKDHYLETPYFSSTPVDQIIIRARFTRKQSFLRWIVRGA